jgi:short-subunit dehydrogenase
LQHEIAGTGVSINMVCPGEVDTPMVQAEADNILPQTRFMKDTIGTLAADEAAGKIAAGIAADRALIVPGTMPWLTSRFARHFPRLFAWSTRSLLALKFKH